MKDNITAEDLFREPQLFVSEPKIHAKVHSKSIDKILGFEISRIEQSLLKKYQAYFKVTDQKNKKQHFQGTQTWIGIHPQTLQTPYEDIFKALSFFKRIQVQNVIDIGAAYGRVGLITKCILPNANFIGLEILKSRVDEGNRIFKKLKLENCKLVAANVLEHNFELP